MNGVTGPLQYNPIQIANAAGAATWTFAYLAAGEEWEFTINCPLAPDTASLTFTSGGNIFGSVIGSNSWGPIQLQGGDQLVVTATGLVPGATYYVNVQGVVTNGGDGLEERWPNAYADSVTASFESIVLGNTGGSAGAGWAINNIPLNVKYVWIACVLGTPRLVTCQFTLPLIGGTGTITVNGYQVNGSNYWRVPVVPGSTSASFSVLVVGNGLTNVSYGYELGIYDVAVSTSITSSFHDVPYGGANHATLNTAGVGTLLSTPAAGTSYRIQSVSIYPNAGASANTQYIFTKAGVPDQATMFAPPST